MNNVQILCLFLISIVIGCLMFFGVSEFNNTTLTSDGSIGSEITTTLFDYEDLKEGDYFTYLEPEWKHPNNSRLFKTYILLIPPTPKFRLWGVAEIKQNVLLHKINYMYIDFYTGINASKEKLQVYSANGQEKYPICYPKIYSESNSFIKEWLSHFKLMKCKVLINMFKKLIY